VNALNDADRLECPDVGPEGLNPIWDEIGHEIMGITIFDYYDRAGNAISMRDWTRLRHWDRSENGTKYTIVAQETVGDYFVSTVWMGINHAFGIGPPLVFETMVFRNSTGESDLDCERYSTEKEAVEGHARMLEQARVMAELER
jgi:hypothetical protein